MSDTEPRFQNSGLLVIDMQNDFVSPGAPAEIPGTMEVVPNVGRLLAFYRSTGLPVIHVVRLYLPDGSNVDRCRREAVARGSSIVLPGSAGAEIVEALRPERGLRLEGAMLLAGGVQRWGDREFVLYKPRWGAFFGTPLEGLLAELNLDTLVICGCNFPNCPRATIYEASERDFRLVFVSDATSGSYPRGEAELSRIGVKVMKTEALLRNGAWLAKMPPS